jgi:hypothetical protein
MIFAIGRYIYLFSKIVSIAKEVEKLNHHQEVVVNERQRHRSAITSIHYCDGHNA